MVIIFLVDLLDALKSRERNTIFEPGIYVDFRTLLVVR